MKIAFIVKNLASKKFGADLEKIQRAFSPDKLRVLVTERPEHAMELAGQATRGGASHLIAVGGDGTLNEVLNGMMQALQKETLPPPVMGQLARGSANDFSRTVGLNGSVGQLMELIRKNQTRKIDLGLASFLNPEKVPAQRYFINIADIGLGGYVAQKMSRGPRSFLGPHFDYLKAITESFIRYKRRTITCLNNDFTREGKTLSLVIAKGKYFGGGLGIAPDADPTDGRFTFVIIGDVTIVDYLLQINRVRKNRPIIHPEVSYRKIKKLEIHSTGYDCPIEMDGEFIGYPPARFSVIPRALDFLMDISYSGTG